ncbi:hypothetical protein [Streptomyces sp. NPDC004783]|uniref:hypothetical protein n=1 Tax=Streptomyces sp. NPDC004783 TaxID=3154459 RepID=UPI0033AF462E
MATRYDTCPTCSTQTGVNVCDNCKNDIPSGEVPAMSGRVWNATLGGFLTVDLCSTCTGQDVNLGALVSTPPSEEPTEPTPPGETGQTGETSQPEGPTSTDTGATPDA